MATVISNDDPTTPEDQFELGKRLFYGLDVDQDVTQAFEWFLKAAQLGNADAQNYVGICYLGVGDLITQDYERAYEWFTKAAQQGHAEAECSLGVCYDKGHGVAKDKDKAFEWYSKSAQQGNASGQTKLGDYCQDRLDYKQAYEWYAKAAEQGLADAQCNLACMYQHGRGVERNDEEAIKWFTKAAQQGCLYSYDVLDEDYGVFGDAE